jgi:hypothetical protein
MSIDWNADSTWKRVFEPKSDGAQKDEDEEETKPVGNCLICVDGLFNDE